MLYTFTLSSHIKASQKPIGFLHHNQIFDVIFEKNDYDIKTLMGFQQTRRLFVRLNWT